MGGQQDGQVVLAADLVQHIQQLALPIDVHPGERLVQNEDMGQGLQRQGQQHPLQLAAGERAQAFVDQAVPMYPRKALQHPCAQASGRGQKDRPVRNGGGEKVQDAHRVPPVEAGGLGHIPDQGPRPAAPRALEHDAPAVGHLSQNGAEQGTLPRPVGADQGHDLPAVKVKGHVLEHFFPAEVHTQPLHLQAAGARAAASRVFVLAYAHPNASTMVSRFFCMASR